MTRRNKRIAGDEPAQAEASRRRDRRKDEREPPRPQVRKPGHEVPPVKEPDREDAILDKVEETLPQGGYGGSGPDQGSAKGPPGH
jgi:hypothetical protein